jgi:acyl-CoA reductase-like NAD-dependent aldehyde dehydrogenase
VQVEAGDDAYTAECFGPVAFLITTSGTDESLRLFVETVLEHGAMTAAVYSTSEDVLDAAEQAALDAGVALSMNLTGQVFVNQSAAFSDFHGTGANPAANATLTDGHYVSGRFRVVQSRRHA